MLMNQRASSRLLLITYVSIHEMMTKPLTMLQRLNV